jgi:hypothetical protein
VKPLDQSRVLNNSTQISLDGGSPKLLGNPGNRFISKPEKILFSILAPNVDDNSSKMPIFVGCFGFFLFRNRISPPAGKSTGKRAESGMHQTAT